jgi:hypothetical protein
MGGMQREGQRGKGHCKLQENGWPEVGRGGLLAFAFQETQEDGYHSQQR